MKTLTFSIILLSVSAFSQNAFKFDSELEKYWYYRDRLQYFVYPGNAPGNSVIMTSRNPCKDYHDYFPIYTSIEFAQTHKLMGYYIGMLATEYKLLVDNMQSIDAYNTLVELNFALDALIRMDQCEMNAPWFLSQSSYDGFFIRDDVPSVLSEDMTLGLNKNLKAGTLQDYYNFIMEDGYVGYPFAISPYAVSGRNKYENSLNYYHQMPSLNIGQYMAHDNNVYWQNYWKNQSFTSNDEIIGDYMGLSLVVTLVSDNATKQKASQIAEKYFTYAEGLIPDDEFQMYYPDGTKIDDDDGGNSIGFIWGICKSYEKMNPNHQCNAHDLMRQMYRSAVNFYSTFNGTGNFYNRGLYSKLVAMSSQSGIYNDVNAIVNIGNEANLETFYLLLYVVLQNKNAEKMNLYPFEKLINDLLTAPCEGPFNYDWYDGPDTLSSGWACEYKYDASLNGQMHGGNDHFGIYPGLDYMLLYNLACLAFPNGFDYEGQHYSFPYYINLNDRHDVYTHYPFVRVYSAQGAHMNPVGSIDYPEEIRAISNIESHMVVSTTCDILYSNSSYQNNNLNFDATGDVTLKAGESIKLTDGFRVDAGAHFLARIESYSCGGLSYKNMAAPPWSENYKGCYYDTLISVPMEKRAPIVYSEDNYDEEDFGMPLWEDFYMYDTTAATELVVGAWLNPNPCGSSATLTVVSENEQQLTIELYDMTGVKRETVFSDIADLNLVLDLNLSSYASGTYMLRITGSGGVKVLRFVKE